MRENSTDLVEGKGIALEANLGIASAALEQCKTDFQRLLVRDSARALAAAAAVLKRRDIQVAASHLVMDAERAIAHAPGNEPRQGERTDLNFTPREGEVLPQQLRSKLRQAHAMDDAAYEALKADSARRQEPLTRQALKPRVAHVAHNSGEVEWYTPPEIIEAARAVMGCIDLDPASTPTANEVVKAKRCFTLEDDGLAQEWSGRIWLNPPYAADLVGRFVAKVVVEASQAIVLVNNATETAWGQVLLSASSTVCFPHGRVRFISPTGTKGAPLQGQMIVGIGVSREAFGREYGATGVCM